MFKTYFYGKSAIFSKIIFLLLTNIYNFCIVVLIIKTLKTLINLSIIKMIKKLFTLWKKYGIIRG